jgi:FtsP/CotA-like multicopper oxidase with cupredoxin domain
MGRSAFAAATLLPGTASFGAYNSGTMSAIISYLLSDSSSDVPKPNPPFGELAIPPLIKPVTRNGVQHYDLDINQAKHTFFEGIETDTYAISASYLGPTLLLTNGDKVSLNYKNNLPVPTTMHGHGMHVPAAMDGTAHQSIEPGTTWSAQYTVNQRACTNWYHPHYMHQTAPHVYQGLAGLLIIEDEESKSLNIPNRYGIDDIPIVLQDRFFSADKTKIDYSPSNMQIARGYIGDVFITNGVIEPIFNAEAKEIRFRLLNGSNSTVYDLGFSNNKSFKQIASDNAFLEAPVNMSRIMLSPGERAEIVVDLTNDTGSSFTLHEYKNNKTFMTINVNKNASAITSVPNRLTTLDVIDTSLVTKTRPFVLDMAGMAAFTINNKAMDMSVINEVVPLGDTEIWEVTNNMNMDHNFHIHATHFRVLERNGSTANVLENEKGYKDVVYLKGRETVKILIKMTDYTDDTVPYMYHCHFLEHEDNGMMGQFTVV